MKVPNFNRERLLILKNLFLKMFKKEPQQDTPLRKSIIHILLN